MAVGGSSVSEVTGAEPAASAVIEHGVLDAAAAAVDDPPAADADADADSGSASGSEIKNWNWIEMPLSTLRWVLAQTRDNDVPVPTLEEHDIYTAEDLERKDPDQAIRTTIATRQAEQDDFFEFQAWVRDVFQRNGRVMVPEDGYQAWVRKVFLRNRQYGNRCVMVLSEDEDVVGVKDELLKAFDEAWGDGIQLDGGDDPEASGTDSSTKQVMLIAPRP